MKTALIPIFLLLNTISIFSQEFKSEKIDASKWDTDHVLTLKSEDSNNEIKIATKSQKVKRTSRNTKQLKINDNSYQIIESCGRINILNAEGEILLKTNSERSEIFLQNNERYFRRKVSGKSGAFEYINSAQQVVVSGQVKGGVILLKNHSRQNKDTLIALCLEELLQHAYDRYLNAIMTSSFLAQLDS